MLQLFRAAYRGYNNSYRGLSRPCWQRIGFTFTESIVETLIFFLTLYFVHDLHLRIDQAGLVMSAYGVGTAIGGFVGGKLSDKFTPGRISIIGLLFMSVGFFILGELHKTWQLMLCLALTGIAVYSFVTANTVRIIDFCKDHSTQQKAISINYAASNLGIGISATVIGFVADYSYHYLFYAASVILIAAAIVMFLLERNKSTTFTHKSSTSAISNKIVHKKTWLGFVILICLFLGGLIIAQLSSTYPVYIRATFPQYATQGVGLLFAINAIIIIIFQAPLSHIFHKINKVLMVGVGSFLMGFGMFLLNESFAYIVAVIACLFYTLGEMSFYSTAQLVCYQQGMAGRKGHSMGLFRSTYATCLIIGPAVGGWLYHHYSGHAVWTVAGAIGLVCLLICLIAKQYYKPSSR